MLSLDAAFERIGTALRGMGYVLAKQEKPPESPGDRLAVFTSPNMSMRVSWTEKARLLALQFEADGKWVDFTRLGFGPRGLEESAVDSLVRAVQKEVGETSTDAG
ncbi:MAG: hypothetical protein ABR576_11195 [Thermoanaerobaculia bacterium]